MSLVEGAFRRKYLTGVPVLKKLTVAFVSAVKTDRITGQKSSHQRGDPHRAGAKQKVGMIGHQNPGVTEGLCFRHKSGQTADKIFLIGFIRLRLNTLQLAAGMISLRQGLRPD